MADMLSVVTVCYLVAQWRGVELRSPPSWSTMAPFDM